MPKVVVGFDGSIASGHALRWARAEALLLGWPLKVVQSWRDPALAISPYAMAWADVAAARDTMKDELGVTIADMQAADPTLAIEAVISELSPVPALLEAVDPDDLMVVGARGHGGFLGLGLGSVSARLARKAPCPIAVVRAGHGSEGSDGGAGRVVVAVDGTDASRAALLWAAAEAERRQSPLAALLAWSYLNPPGVTGEGSFSPEFGPEDADAILAQIVDDVLGSAAAASVEKITRCDLAPAAILEQSKDAAMVVVGAHGSKGPGLFGLGSVSQQVVEHADGIVVVVRTKP